MDLQIKLEKSIFYIYKIKYLGYIIIENGVKINSKKISIIVGWLTPKNVHEVQSFLGFINFYYRFIRKYSKITASLINLIKKDSPWVQNNNMENMFQGLKK